MPLRSRALIGAGLALTGTTVAAVVLQAAAVGRAQSAAELHRPRQVMSDGYASSNECRSCHPSEYASWSDSYHRSMTQLATPKSVFGTFDRVELGEAPHYRLEQQADGFFVNIASTSGQPEQRHPITLVTGSHHMQIYWYETGKDRTLGQLPFVYLKADQRWVPRNAIFLEPPRELRPSADGRWNSSCIACHTTLGQPRIDAQGEFDTQVAEFGIACEACHGPGQPHVAKNGSPLVRYRSHLLGAADEGIAQPKKLGHDRGSYVCSQCHATWLHNGPAGMRRWNEHGYAYRPGADPAESLLLLQPSRAANDPRVADVMAHQEAFVDGQFWRDGVIRISGREFNGMIDSACYLRGELSCMSCHTMHRAANDRRPLDAWTDDQLGVGMDTDRACLQCHAELAGKLTAHTQHAAESDGSRCYNCHMPHTTYGLLKAIRSHRIDVPSVTATVTAGRPNACNLCHLDKSLGWTAHWLRQRYGIESPPLDPDQENVEAAVLIGLTGDAGQRALIAWALGWAPAQAASNHAFMPALLGVLMDDPYDAVRYIAVRSLRSLPDIDGRTLAYDFVPRPTARAAVAEQVASLGAAKSTAAEQQRLKLLFERLEPHRDDHSVLLLE